MAFWKRITTAVFLSGLLAVISWAQFSKADMMKMASERLDTITKSLNLSPAQVDKIRPLLGAQMEDVGKAKEKYAASGKSDADKKEAEDTIKESNAKYHDQIKGELSPEQVSKWDSMSKSWNKKDTSLKGIK